MFDVPITTIEQAKDFFMAMGCSSFHISRDYPQRYDEFEKMNVSENLQIEWRRESVDNHLTKLFEEKNYSNLWLIHSNMAHLVEELKTKDVLKKMLTATQYIREKVPFKYRVIVAETINGRKSLECRSGLIYLSYDLQCPILAKEFADLSIHFAMYEVGQTQDFKRCQEATQTCNQIIAVIEKNGFEEIYQFENAIQRKEKIYKIYVILFFVSALIDVILIFADESIIRGIISISCYFIILYFGLQKKVWAVIIIKCVVCMKIIILLFFLNFYN